MIRIRFHGRGGHGTKTASRIVGTAAFLSGLQAQDSPVYGAERRGAPVVAFTRIDSNAILERGVIEQPDLIVLADETLLRMPEVGVLDNNACASAIFINTEAKKAKVLGDEFGITSLVIGRDLTTLTRNTIGVASALSAGLGAAAARMAGQIAYLELERAICEELSHRRLDDELIRKNIDVAADVYHSVSPVDLQQQPFVRRMEMVDVVFAHPLLSTPSVLHTGNAVARKTGSWRIDRPVIDTDACTCCGLCFTRCPDGAIQLNDEGYPVIDYDHCKGCMICHEICPVQAIASERETKAW